MQVVEERRLVLGELAQLDHRRLEPRQEVIEEMEVRCQVVAPLRGDRRRPAGVVDEVDDVLAPVRQLLEDRVGVRVELGDRPVLLAEDVEHLL